MLSDTNQRKIQVYPTWYYHMLTVAYAFKTNQTKAEAMEKSNEKFFDTLSEKEKSQLIETYHSMTEEERRYPKKARPKRFDDSK